MTSASEHNRELARLINRDIWNDRRFDKLADYFSDDFVMDYSPHFVRRGCAELRAAVERSHQTFEGFREEIKTIVADNDRVVVHFTITGRQTGHWGPLPPTGRAVAFDEIVIMTVQQGKVVHQTGVIDNVTGLRQVGLLPTPRED